MNLSGRIYHQGVLFGGVKNYGYVSGMLPPPIQPIVQLSPPKHTSARQIALAGDDRQTSSELYIWGHSKSHQLTDKAKPVTGGWIQLTVVRPIQLYWVYRSCKMGYKVIGANIKMTTE